jgi:hypothetical protein
MRGGNLASACYFRYAKIVTDAISGTRKRGRPKTGALSVHLRIEPVMLDRIDAWISAQEEQPSRPEAIRRLLNLALDVELGQP